MQRLIFIPPALLVSLLLFMLMAHLAGVGRAAEPVLSTPSAIQLQRLLTDSPVQRREREPLPPPAPLPPPPPSPALPQGAPPLALASPSVALNLPLPELAKGLQVEAAVALPALSSLAQPVPAAAPALAMRLDVAPLARINPQYPRRALARRLEGYVVAEFTVDARGRVVADSFRIVEADPAGVFDAAVERAVLRWRFDPQLENGVAVPFRTRQRLEFKLE